VPREIRSNEEDVIQRIAFLFVAPAAPLHDREDRISAS